MEHPRGPFCGRAVVGKASQARYEGRRANSVKVTNEFGVVGLGRMGGGLEKQALGKKMVVVGKLDYLTTLETGSKQALFVWKRAKVREMSREVRGKSVED
jgi:hypothetical protein